METLKQFLLIKHLLFLQLFLSTYLLRRAFRIISNNPIDCRLTLMSDSKGHNYRLSILLCDLMWISFVVNICEFDSIVLSPHLPPLLFGLSTHKEAVYVLKPRG